jgi:hypothetical protein
MMRKALLSSLSEVMNLRSESLWKKALYGLEDVDLPGATDALIEIARKANHPNGTKTGENIFLRYE